MQGEQKQIQHTIRVLIMRERDYLVAQCLEYDIAVQGRSVEEVSQRFREVVTDHVILASEHDDVPFSNLEPAPPSYEHFWNNASRIGMLAQKIKFKLSVLTTHPVTQQAEMAIS